MATVRRRGNNELQKLLRTTNISPQRNVVRALRHDGLSKKSSNFECSLGSSNIGSNNNNRRDMMDSMVSETRVQNDETQHIVKQIEACQNGNALDLVLADCDKKVFKQDDKRLFLSSVANRILGMLQLDSPLVAGLTLLH